MNEPLVSWDAISLRVDGARANAIAQQFAAGQVDEIRLTFRAGNIHIAGKKRVGIIPVPFFADINSIQVDGKRIIVPVSILPIAAPILRGIVATRIPAGVTIHPPFTFVIQLDRFLPNTVDVQVREIRIIDGGLAVDIGPGGATWQSK